MLDVAAHADFLRGARLESNAKLAVLVGHRNLAFNRY